MPEDLDNQAAADSACMVRLAQGDDLALNELMNRWRSPLIAFFYRSLGSREDAEDLAQQVFVRIYRHRKKFRPKKKFSTWMFAIANNLLRNQIRWKKRHPELNSEAITETVTNVPDAQLSQIERAEEISVAIQELPPKMRTATLLFYYEGMSHREIAQVLRTGTKSVESLLYRSRKQLESQLLRLKE